jgi:Uma2 family endonuclease
MEELDVSDDLDLIDSDGEPLESEWHVIAIPLLLGIARYHNRRRKDYFAGGNMFIYYQDEASGRRRRFRGPDFFFVSGVAADRLRPSWTVWLEGGRFPNLIIELLSRKTAKVDRTIKKDIYEKVFRTHEFFCYDPRKELLQGWRLRGGKYRDIKANDKGWMWSKELGLWLGTWRGKHEGRPGLWLRFYDEAGNVVPTFAEAAQKKARREHVKNVKSLKRAETAEAELARLKAQLRQNGKPNGKKKGSS